MTITFCALCMVANFGSAQSPSQDSTLRDHDTAGRVARNAGDWVNARYHARRMDEIVGGHPATKRVIAQASMHLGDTTAAMQEMELLARMGISIDLTADSVLKPLATKYPALNRQLRKNAEAAGMFTTVATMPRADFVAEGIASDPVGHRTFMSSIRHGTVAQISAKGQVSDYVDLVRDGGWSGLGLAVDAARNRLWVSTMWYPHGIRIPAADSGRSAIHLYDLARGTLVRRFEIPRGAHEPGDICIAPNGDLFVSDGQDATIRVIRNASDSLATFVAPGVLVSPQGCAVDAARQQLLVADYALGVMSVSLVTGRVTRMQKSPTALVNQIDGLIMTGDQLIGVQNGVTPNRIVLMQLDSAHAVIGAVTVIVRDSVRVSDPTHVTLSGNDLLFVENSGFGKYDENGKLRAGATDVAPRIGRVALPLMPARKN